MNEPFLTIAKDTAFELVIKKSRFICSLKRVNSETAAQEFIKEIQAQIKRRIITVSPI